MNNNINNLFEFYREVGSCSSVSFTHITGYSVVSGENNSWPQMVFGIDFSENPAQTLNQVLNETVNQNLPGFNVCNAGLFGEEEVEFLRQNGIYPVKFWTLMHTVSQTVPKNRNMQNLENIEIRELNKSTEIEAFTALVNTEFNQNANLSFALAKEINMKKACSFYGLFVAGKLVSGLLKFSDTKTAGLYFIATNSAFRGKGFAADLIGRVTDLCLENLEEVVLQAVQKAVPLYKRLGFVTQGKLVIFWKKAIL